MAKKPKQSCERCTKDAVIAMSERDGAPVHWFCMDHFDREMARVMAEARNVARRAEQTVTVEQLELDGE